MRRLLLLGSMLFAVGGCTVVSGPGWAGDGTAAAFDADMANCDKAAVAQYPPMTMGVPGYFATPDQFCSPTPAGTNCMIINPGYLPQAKSAGDTNALPRANAFHVCMVSKGWSPVYQAGGEAFTPPGGPSKAVIAQALQYCEASFRGHPNDASDTERFHDCVMTRVREPGAQRPPG